MSFKRDKNFWRLWFAIVGTAGIVLVAAYAMVQQQNRLSAYDTPLALNQVVAYRLSNGATPTQALPSDESSLSDMIPFAIITDGKQQVLASSQKSGMTIILPPPGTFNYAKIHKQDRFSWQPTANVRLATIITYDANNDRFIVTGQSLHEAESRIAVISGLMLFSGMAVVIWTTLALTWRR